MATTYAPFSVLFPHPSHQILRSFYPISADEGNGHISAEQYLMLEMLRSKHGVTNGDHVQLLKNHGWSLERYESPIRLPASGSLIARLQVRGCSK